MGFGAKWDSDWTQYWKKNHPHAPAAPRGLTWGARWARSSHWVPHPSVQSQSDAQLPRRGPRLFGTGVNITERPETKAPVTSAGRWLRSATCVGGLNSKGLKQMCR